jgi:release factor glutamine methyltransferase
VSDTWLLASAMIAEGVRARDVADLCCGCGALAITASCAGARSALAVDISHRAVIATRMNARLNHCSVDVRRGDLIAALAPDDADVIVCNPPYVPAETDELPRHRSTTPLDGGRDGRALLDRVCVEAPFHLRPGGVLLVVQSSVSDPRRSLRLLREAGLECSEASRLPGRLGPVMHERRSMLRKRGLLGEADREDLVVVRATKRS